LLRLVAFSEVPYTLRDALDFQPPRGRIDAGRGILRFLATSTGAGMSDGDWYREQAEMAERLAEEMTVARQREDLFELACYWRLLAEKADATAAGE
jgi:hypothetical protein